MKENILKNQCEIDVAGFEHYVYLFEEVLLDLIEHSYQMFKYLSIFHKKFMLNLFEVGSVSPILKVESVVIRI